MKSALMHACLFLGAFSTFAFSAVTWTTIDYPGAALTNANGINSSGQIVGTFIVTSGVQSFLLSGGVFTTIQFPGGNTTTFAEGINDAGDVAGSYAAPGIFSQAFIMQGSTFTAINFPGSSNTEAWGINNADQVVGSYAGTDGHTHGFLWDAGTFTTIDVTGAQITSLTGIDNFGDIVGEFLVSDNISGGVQHPFDAPGATNTLGWGINDHFRLKSADVLNRELSGNTPSLQN
jgi:probable HAF family extracellular repeat protein